jgi:AraC family transcriptional regulator of adaptative response / DNA-3-methyladenine glycosylase II
LDRCDGCFEISHDENSHVLVVRLQFGDPRSLFFITERIRAMFDLNADWSAIVQSLRSDPLLATAVECGPGLRVPGCWNGFELATRAILGQQITVKGATALAGRMACSLGKPFASGNGLTHLFPTPEVLAEAKLDRIGLTGARAETIRALARRVCDGRFSFDRVVDSNALLSRLCEIPGIGQWTAQYIAMRALGEPDAFPSSDLGLLRAMGVRSSRELEVHSKAWRPWRAYAAMYLWRIGSHSTERNNRPVAFSTESRASTSNQIAS